MGGTIMVSGMGDWRVPINMAVRDNPREMFGRKRDCCANPTPETNIG